MPRLSEIISRRQEPRTKHPIWPWDLLIPYDGTPFSDLGWLILIAGIFLVAVLVIFLAIPFVIFAVQAAVVLLLGASGAATKVLFKRPWTVEASTEGEARTWNVVGFRNAGRALVAIDLQLRTYGQPLPDLPPDVTGRLRD